MVRFLMWLEKGNQKPLGSPNGTSAKSSTSCALPSRSSAGFPSAPLPVTAPTVPSSTTPPSASQCAELRESSFLLVDSGGQYRDGTTDITRTYALGPLTDEEREAYTLVLKCHIAAARAVFKAGSAGMHIDILARETLWRRGLDYRCGTGHGVGFVGVIHEGPQGLSAKK